MRVSRIASYSFVASACGILMNGGVAAQGVADGCYIEMSPQGQSCVCETEAGISEQQADMTACRVKGEDRLSALTPSSSPPPGVVTPENPPTGKPPIGGPPNAEVKGNNGIGNDEAGSPPGIGNSGNDVDGARTAKTSGPGAKGPGGSRPDSK